MISPGLRHIALVEGHDLRQLGKPFAVRPEFGVDGVEIMHRVAPAEARNVYQMHQQPGALDVPQELMSQPRALVRALDETRHVRDDKAGVGDLDHAEIRRRSW